MLEDGLLKQVPIHPEIFNAYNVLWTELTDSVGYRYFVCTAQSFKIICCHVSWHSDEERMQGEGKWKGIKQRFLSLPTSIFIKPSAEMRWLSNASHLLLGYCYDHTKAHVVWKHLKGWAHLVLTSVRSKMDSSKDVHLHLALQWVSACLEWLDCDWISLPAVYVN